MSDRIPASNTPIINTFAPQTSDIQTPRDKQAERYENTISVLESAFPFFGDQDRAVNSRRGKADKPPVDNGTTKSAGEKVKDFFKAIGKAIATPFKMIGQAIEKAQIRSQERAQHKAEVQKQENHIESKLARDGSVLHSDTVEFLARAVSVKDVNLAVKVLNGVAANLEGLDVQTKAPRKDQIKGDTMQEKVVSMLGEMAGPLGYIMTPTLMDSLTEMLPELKVKLADNPVGLAVLERFENHYDFQTLMDDSFTSEVAKLTTIDTAVTVEDREDKKHIVLESAFRGNSFFTSGMKGLVMEQFDNETFGRGLIDKFKVATSDTPGFATATSTELKLDVVSQENGRALTNGAEAVLNTLLDGDVIVGELGSRHIDTLRDKAQQIADMPNVSSDVKNKMIQKLFIDQVFLRNLNATITQMGQADNVLSQSMMATSQLVQVLLNDADPTRPPNGNIADKFNELRSDTKDKIADLMTQFRMPHVDPQPNDWTPPPQGL